MDIHEVIIITPKDQEQNIPTLDDYGKVCRICLQTLKTDKYKDIHEEEAQMLIRSLIEVYTFVKIPELKDSLPQNVCTKCIDFLLNVHMFRSRCRLNHDLLLKIQQRNEVKSSNRDTASKTTDLSTDKTQELIDKINDERMGIFRCKDCQLVFYTAQDLKKHRYEVKHSRRRASECPQCGKLFNSAALKLHMRTHTKEKPFVCKTCGVSFTVKNNLHRHSKIHDGERAFTCDECGKSFTRSESLAYHMRLHKDKESTVNQGEEQQCPECKKMYPSLEQLRIHMRYHKKMFLCTTCGKVFSTKANLTTHLRVHTGERPYVCKICKKAFTQSSSLKTHMGIHVGDKKFTCEYCGRKFAVKGNLRVHQRIHTGETPHNCTICMKGFCTSSTLRKHMQKHVKDDAKLRTVIINQKIEESRQNSDDTYSVVEVKLEDGDLVCQEEDDTQDVEEVTYADDVYVEQYIENEEFSGLQVGREIQVIYNVNEELQEIVYKDGAEHIAEENIEYEVQEEEEEEGQNEHIELCISDENDCYNVQVIEQKYARFI